MAFDTTFPTLRVEIEGVRRTLVQHLDQYDAGIVDAIRKQIDAQLTPENIDRMVGEAVRQELPGVIRGAIASALAKVRWDTEISDLLFASIGKALKEVKGGPA